MDKKIIFGKRLKSAREMKGLSMANLVEMMADIVSSKLFLNMRQAKCFQTALY